MANLKLEIYNKETNETIDTETDPSFKDFNIYISLNGVIYIEDKNDIEIIGTANKKYGVRVKGNQEHDTIK